MNLIVSIAAVLVVGGAFAQEAVVLPPITKAAQKINVAVAPMEVSASIPDAAKISTELVAVLEGDLAFTGWFTPLTNRGFIEETHKEDLAKGAIQYNEWRTLRAQVLITGKVEPAAGNRLTATFQLHDVVGGQPLKQATFTGGRDMVRRLGHFFSDVVYEHYSKRKGIAATRIAFVNRTSKGDELYVMDYDGGGLIQKTFDNSKVMAPAWSPNGEAVIFSSMRGGFWDVYRLTLSSGRIDKLAAFPGINTQASYHPDGEELALILSKTGNPEVHLFNLRTGALRRLTFTSAVENSPSVSPDGKQVVYASDSTGQPEVYLLDLSDPQNPRRMTRLGGHNDTPMFSPDGKKIVFASSSRGGFDVFTMNSDGSEITAITSGNGHEETPSWSPNGEFLCYTGNRLGKYDIYIMRADGTESRRITYLQGENILPAWSTFLK